MQNCVLVIIRISFSFSPAPGNQAATKFDTELFAHHHQFFVLVVFCPVPGVGGGGGVHGMATEFDTELFVCSSLPVFWGVLIFIQLPCVSGFFFFFFCPAPRGDARRGDQVAAEHDAELCAAGVHEGAGPPHRCPAQRPAQARPGLWA